MKYVELNKQSLIKPTAGKLLIAEPFLSDPTFSRSVVLLCEHGADGSIGFVLNQISDFKLNHLLPEVNHNDIRVYNGGPVQKETLHILHKVPQILGGQEILPGVFWGGSYSNLSKLIEDGDISNNEVRLYLGYSGWDTNQLDAEIAEGAWLVGKASNSLIFEEDESVLWKEAIRSLGSQFHYMINTPMHPQLN